MASSGCGNGNSDNDDKSGGCGAWYLVLILRMVVMIIAIPTSMVIMTGRSDSAPQAVAESSLAPPSEIVVDLSAVFEAENDVSAHSWLKRRNWTRTIKRNAIPKKYNGQTGKMATRKAEVGRNGRNNHPKLSNLVPALSELRNMRGSRRHAESRVCLHLLYHSIRVICIIG